ncbi:alpha/beta fold hydrolase [Phaeovulum sp. W22_SRMD_FR3]|uniref:alpha/beta fold hydrolase n=1 Tax=Phaeovulum sp. W22_SRMD_FR3 TaxID=3240274 RepID=UPI003F997821
MLQLAYFADPESDLPPLLLVHGILVSHRTWDPNVALSAQFRRICVDLPGHGASPAAVTAAEAHPDVLIQALDRVRTRLNIPRWHVCGQSFGAALALRYALSMPGHCATVTITNANAALRAQWTEEAERANSAQVAQIRSEGHAAIRQMIYHPAKARHFAPDIREILSAEAERTDPESIALLLQEAIPRLSVQARLAELACPALLVNGLRERRFQAARAWLAATHPAFRIVDLPGGHSINVECPQGFNAALSGFAAEHPL